MSKQKLRKPTCSKYQSNYDILVLFFSLSLIFKSKIDVFKVSKSLQFFIFMLKSKKPLLLSSQKAQKEQRASYTNCLSIIKPCYWSSTLREKIALKYITVNNVNNLLSYGPFSCEVHDCQKDIFWGKTTPKSRF